MNNLIPTLSDFLDSYTGIQNISEEVSNNTEITLPQMMVTFLTEQAPDDITKHKYERIIEEGVNHISSMTLLPTSLLMIRSSIKELIDNFTNVCKKTNQSTDDMVLYTKRDKLLPTIYERLHIYDYGEKEKLIQQYSIRNLKPKALQKIERNLEQHVVTSYNTIIMEPTLKVKYIYQDYYYLHLTQQILTQFIHISSHLYDIQKLYAPHITPQNVESLTCKKKELKTVLLKLYEIQEHFKKLLEFFFHTNCENDVNSLISSHPPKKIENTTIIINSLNNRVKEILTNKEITQEWIESFNNRILEIQDLCYSIIRNMKDICYAYIDHANENDELYERIQMPNDKSWEGGKPTKQKRLKLIYVGKVKCKDGYTRKSYKKRINSNVLYVYKKGVLERLT